MVGQLGESAIAAVGLSNQFYFIYNLLLFGLSSGGSIFIAQYWGIKESENISKTTVIMLAVAFIFLFPFFILSVFFPLETLRLFSPDINVIQTAIGYLRLIGYTLFPAAITYVFYSVMRSTEYAFIAMVFSAITMISNAVLNYIFIFGVFGVPAYGVFGAGIATLISRIAELFIVIFYVYVKNLPGKFQKKHFAMLTKSFFKRFMVYTLPAVGNEFSWSMGITMYAIVYSHISTDVLAAHRMMNSIENFTFAFLFSIATATAILIGQELGKKNFEDAILISKKSIGINFILSFFTGITVYLLSSSIFGVYNVKDEVRELANLLLGLSLLFLPIKSLNALFVVGVFRAGGDTKYTLYIEGGTLWVIGVPLTAIFGLVVKAPFIWVFSMSLIEEVVKIILLYLRYRTKKWVRNVIG
jgi:putative MATE family efflux protein